MISEKSRNDLLQEFEDAPLSALFSQVMIAAIRGCSMKTIERDRRVGGGVPFRKIGRLVRYSKKDILEWISGHEVATSTFGRG